jgi:hypothetical protein
MQLQTSQEPTPENVERWLQEELQADSKCVFWRQNSDLCIVAQFLRHRVGGMWCSGTFESGASDGRVIRHSVATTTLVSEWDKIDKSKRMILVDQALTEVRAIRERFGV